MKSTHVTLPRSIIEQMMAVLENGEGHKLGCKTHAFSDTCTCGYDDSVNAAIAAGRIALEADIANLGEPYGWQVQGLRDTFKGNHAELDAKAEAARVGGTAYAFPIYIDPTAVTESTP